MTTCRLDAGARTGAAEVERGSEVGLCTVGATKNGGAIAPPFRGTQGPSETVDNSPSCGLARKAACVPWENGKGDVAKGYQRNSEDLCLKTIHTHSNILRYPFAIYPFSFSQVPSVVWARCRPAMGAEANETGGAWTRIVYNPY